jgi:hypothetical protein
MSRGPRQTGSKEVGERRVGRVTHLARPRREQVTTASEENRKWIVTEMTAEGK